VKQQEVESSALLLQSMEEDRQHEWPSLPERNKTDHGMGTEVEDQEVSDDWDLLSTAGSVWTTDTTIFGDRNSFLDVVSRHRPQQSGDAKNERSVTFINNVSRSKKKEKSGEVEENDFLCVAIWEGYKYGRGR
jgi:hypothetical protein